LYYPLLGAAAGWITAFPAIRPAGIPLPYYLLIAAAFLALVTGRLRLDRATIATIACFAFTIAYVDLHALLFQRELSLGPLARTLIGFVLFALIVSSVASGRDLRRVVLWMLPFWTLSQAVAIGQFFGRLEAIALPILLLPEEAFEEDEIISLETIRIFGLLGLPHVFGYGTGLITLAAVGAATLQRRGTLTQLILITGALLSLVTTVLSAQRSAVWPVVAILVLWTVVTARGLSKILVPMALTFVVVGMLTWRLGSTGGMEWIGLERLGSVSTGADNLRLQTWAEGIRMVLSDPLLGTAYDTRDVGVGIHNGFLRGWAQFGAIWLLLVLLCGSILVLQILQGSASQGTKVVALGILATVAANSLSHTLIVTINDLISWAFLAIAWLLANSPRAVSPDTSANASGARLIPDAR
jgi:hypothetical protein